MTGKPSPNLPWVEKYRPKQLDDLISHQDIISTINKFVSQNRLPHLLFYGPPGTGKTSTILAVAKQMYTPTEFHSMVLELNASDDRGIGIVRGQILSFASTRTIFRKGFKLVILDEADAMTRDAQNSLRRVIEKFTDNVRFCIICNYLSKIIPALQSRCTRFRFAPLSPTQMGPRLDHVITEEGVNITEDGKKAVLTLAKGDMRKSLNILQSTSMAFDSVTENAVYTCVGHPLRADIENLVYWILNEDFTTAYNNITDLKTSKGLALQDILTEVHEYVHKTSLKNKPKTREAFLADIDWALDHTSCILDNGPKLPDVDEESDGHNITDVDGESEGHNVADVDGESEGHSVADVDGELEDNKVTDADEESEDNKVTDVDEESEDNKVTDADEESEDNKVTDVDEESESEDNKVTDADEQCKYNNVTDVDDESELEDNNVTDVDEESEDNKVTDVDEESEDNKVTDVDEESESEDNKVTDADEQCKYNNVTDVDDESELEDNNVTDVDEESEDNKVTDVDEESEDNKVTDADEESEDNKVTDVDEESESEDNKVTDVDEQCKYNNVTDVDEESEDNKVTDVDEESEDNKVTDVDEECKYNNVTDVDDESEETEANDMDVEFEEADMVESENDFEDICSDDSNLDPSFKPRELVDLESDSDSSETSAVVDYYPALTLTSVANDTVFESPPTTVCVSENEADKGHTHTHPSEPDECVVRDKKFPNIYIRKGDLGKSKKRIYNNYHCCLVCKKLKSNIRKHVLSHKENPTVRKILQLKLQGNNKKEIQGNNKKEIQRLLAILRNAGDNAHNLNVCTEKKGELIVSRRAIPFNYKEYGPCSNCLEWMKMGLSVTKHVDSCPASLPSQEKLKLTRKQMLVRSNVLKGLLAPEASEQLIANVFPIMTRDEISEIAQKDSLIVAFGNFVYRSNVNNKAKRKYTTSSKMRAAARLLRFLRQKHGNGTKMCEFLNVDFFEDVVEAALESASPNSDDVEDLKHPTAAIKAGHDITHMANIQLALAVKERNVTAKEELGAFLFIMEKEWQSRVGALAKKILRDRKMLVNVKLPKPSDLQQMADYLKVQLTKENYESYRATAQYCLCRLLLYNKRRSGELEATELQSYFARSKSMDESDEALMGDLTELEKRILGSQEIMRIEGKGQQIVPVIIPTDTTRALQYISEDSVRKSANIKSSNKYLFATSGDGPIRAYDTLKGVCDEVGVAVPETMTSVNLRKYFATMTQVIGLKDHELGWLCKHMGHTVNVHKLHYRAASGYIERLNIGKLMMIQDFNVASKFVGQRLDDIQVDDIIKGAEPKQVCADSFESVPQSSTSLSSVVGNASRQKVKEKNKMVRQRWTAEEEEELRILFKDNLQKCSTLELIGTHLIDLPMHIRIHLLEKMAEIEYRLSAGTSEKIQLSSLIAAFQVTRDLIVAEAKDGDSV